MDDWQLLQDYVERESETAFRTLVNRYVNLVYSVALRQVRDAQLAEEVAQAVFILLARKARGFRPGLVITAWLFRTTRFVASRAIRAEQRRQRREQEALAMQELTATDETWKRIAPTIDEAIESLGETDRNAVLLRFFNDKSHRETAAALGVSEDAAKKRVTRALDKLRNYFAGRGVTLSATLLASAVATNAAKTATPEVVASLTAKVTASGSIVAKVLPPLVNQTLSAWRWAKLKSAGGLAIAVFTAAFLFYSRTRQEPGINQFEQITDAKTALTALQAPDPNTNSLNQAILTPANMNESNTMRFYALDAQTSGGIAGAKVAVNYTSLVRWWAGDDLVTDAQGLCSVPIPRELVRLDVGVLQDGYVQKFYTWRKDSEEPLPTMYLLRMEHGVPIGGWVRDESGRAVSGADVIVNFGQQSDSTDREPQVQRLGFIRDLVAARTDTQGRWKCAIVPAGYNLPGLGVRHPQFATETVAVTADDQGHVNAPPRLAMKDLWAAEGIILLRAGFRVAGVVLDDSDQPIAGAKVSTFGNTRFPAETTTTKSDGRFEFSGVAAGNIELGASAAGFAPANQTISVQSNFSNLAFRLEHGTVVAVRLVDEQGGAIVGAWMAAEGSQRQNAEWHATSDANGWARIEGIPEAARGSLRFHAGGKGFFYSRDQRVDLSATDPKLQLMRALKVSGRVVAAGSGEPIAWFKAIPCRSEGVAGYDRMERKFGTNGNFIVTFSEFQPPFRVRIEADGYEPALSLPLPLDPREQSVELKLQRKDPSKAMRGTVLRPDGRAAAGADVVLLTFERGAELIAQGRFRTQYAESIFARTDADGKFQFDPDVNSHTIVAAHESGFGRTRIRQDSQTVVVTLSQWGSIEGQVQTLDRNWSKRDAVLTTLHSGSGFSVNIWAKSDGEGRFSMERVPAGDYTIHLTHDADNSLTDATPVEVRAGETTRVQIGGSGAIVTGHLQFAASVLVDWARQLKSPRLQPKANSSPFRNAPLMYPLPSDPAERQKRLDLVESDEWRAWARTRRPVIALKVSADGLFVGEGVRAGEYTLHIDLAGVAADSSGDLVASLMRPTTASIRLPVVVTEAQERAGETLDLGALELQPVTQNRDEGSFKILR